MPLTTAEQVRATIADPARVFIHPFFADGSGKNYILPHTNVTSGTAEIQDSNQLWSATASTISNSGEFILSHVVSADSALRARYVWSVFSDADIDHYLSAGGNVLGASLLAMRNLMFDSLKRARWASPDGTQYDDTMALNSIDRIYARLKDAHDEEAAVGGGFNNWVLTQEGV